MLTTVLAFLGKIFSSIVSEVLKDVLKTPAKEVEITISRGEIDLPPTPVDDLLTEYGM